MQITKEEVKQILEKVKACVNNDKFRISLNPNRIENQSFINDYRLTTKQQKRMILELDIYDFSKIDIDRKNKIQILYFFGREYELNHHIEIQENIEYFKNVETYIKFTLVERNTEEMILFISFHKANYPINYRFKKS